MTLRWNEAPPPDPKIPSSPQGRTKTDIILQLTLEIIYLLTGEVFAPSKKSGDYAESSRSPDALSDTSSQSPMVEPPLTYVGKNQKKILEITNKITELLTGEVPIRCEDVAVYLSMEEREYLERHSDLYKAAMMEEEPTLKSPDVSRAPPTAYSGTDTEEEPGSAIDVDLTVVKIEPDSDEEDVMTGDELQIPTEMSTDVSGQINPEERAPPTAYSGTDSEEEPSSAIGIDLTVVKIEPDSNEEDVMTGDELQIPTEMSTDQEFVIKTEELPTMSTDDLQSGSSARTTFIKDLSFLDLVTRHIYHCTECGQIFSQPEELLSHQKTHGALLEPKPELRDQLFCGKSVSYKHDHVQRESTHAGEKPFSCTTCGRRFQKRFNLDAHQRTHTGEKPFPCLQCGKSFRQKSTLVRHEITHTGLHPYSCSVCRKTFAQKSGLVRHEVKHTSAFPYTCSECGKGFTAISVLLSHQRVHTEEKPFSCSY